MIATRRNAAATIVAQLNHYGSVRVERYRGDRRVAGPWTTDRRLWVSAALPCWAQIFELGDRAYVALTDGGRA